MLGNICFSEQIFYRKQSLGAPANEAECEVECFSEVKTDPGRGKEILGKTTTTTTTATNKNSN